jgi:transcriptional regulator with XRE-family HTH domain
MNLGETIKNNRQKRGIKAKDFAVLCGITPAYLSQIENNRKDATLPVLRVISKELGLPLPILFLLALDDKDIEAERYNTFMLLILPMVAAIKEFFTVRLKY